MIERILCVIGLVLGLIALYVNVTGLAALLAS